MPFVITILALPALLGAAQALLVTLLAKAMGKLTGACIGDMIAKSENRPFRNISDQHCQLLLVSASLSLALRLLCFTAIRQ
jgi:hypothetical protein